jgi:hypothetical protein
VCVCVWSTDEVDHRTPKGKDSHNLPHYTSHSPSDISLQVM